MINVWFVMSALSLFVVFITMLCRANDLRWRSGLKWQVRLIGFVICGTMPVGVVLASGIVSPWEALFHMGLMMVFVTTPHLPPWWRWISGQEDASDTN